MITLKRNHIENLCNSRKMLLTDLPLNYEDNNHILIKDDYELQNIASLLNVTVRDLFELPKVKKGVIKQESKNAYRRTSQRNNKDYYTYEHMVTVPEESNLMSLKVILHCQNENDIQLNDGHPSKELVYVTKGTIRVDWVESNDEKKTDILNVGDSLYIYPNTPHSFMSLENNSELLAFNY
ncbi:cupin domain-containing protein [Staphylococcus epidermidis]|jgi:mannose-6-phosphate isomerase-like protein (cupin superfamily)|uniref:cupin domain-containing protein n=1 Tax=Staphylococcus epidermidis TaxID=1282 RepID=UPI00188751E2|nr:cupin domain-containing protein [Staphylococcus epidermidis]MBF2304038.1 cupin domain-containing protein [Staphylococcus epidermidis]MBF2330575.1 cupin domain-containing protein [Staphylococcus epidermidis]